MKTGRATSVMPAQAGIHKLLILNANYKLESGLRRNDEFFGRQQLAI